jgi:hypothetical protein
MGQKHSTDKEIDSIHGASVFVSFSRQDESVVVLLYEALSTEQRRVWVDWEAIPPSASFRDEIRKAIEGSDVFLFIMSPDSIKSERCNWEIDYACRLGKRIVPLLCRNVDYAEVQPQISSLSWIYFRPNQDKDFLQPLKHLLHALDEDYPHLCYHTKFLTRAITWQRNAFSHTALLTGKDLKRAKHWLSSASRGARPKPTSLHLSYVTSSLQRASTMSIRYFTSIFVGVIVITAMIWPTWGVFFFALMFSLVFIYFMPN